MSHDVLNEHLHIPVPRQPAMGAYLAYPSAPGRYPAVIVGMELFGLTEYIRNVTNRVAALGYVAIAPNFYHRVEENVDLPYDQIGRTRGFELLGQLSRDDALEDVRATMDYLARRPEFLGRVGFLGLSVGGHIGYLAATRLDLAACAIFYAGWLSDTGIPLSRPEPTLDLTPGIAEHGGRILYLVGGKDAIVSAQQREDIAQALTTANVRHELVVYPEAKHGFFCEDRDTYDPAAAADAWQRTIALLSSELRK